MPDTQPRCVRCVHYFVTYEPAYPHACRFFGIRTRPIPSIEVLRSSGESCHAFEERTANPSPVNRDNGRPRR